MANLITIDDSNFQQVLGDGERVWVNGHWRYLSAKVEKPRFTCSRTTMAEANLQVFAEDELKDRINQIKKDRAWIKDLMYETECPDQDGYGQCWCFGTCEAFWMRSWLQGGMPRMLSPNALARDAGYSNWGSGGGDPTDSVNTLIKTGGVRESIWPSDSSGHSMKWDTPQANADHDENKIVTCVEIEPGKAGYLAQVSAVVQGCPLVCTWNWWNHVTAGCWAEVVGSEIQFGIRNSWGTDWSDRGFGLLAGTRKYSSATWAIVEVTQSTKVPA